MTKAEIISKISDRTGVEKTTTTAVLESLMFEIKESIKKNESVFLRGFGTFLAKERKEKRQEIEELALAVRTVYNFYTKELLFYLWKQHVIVGSTESQSHMWLSVC